MPVVVPQYEREHPVEEEPKIDGKCPTRRTQAERVVPEDIGAEHQREGQVHPAAQRFEKLRSCRHRQH